MKATFLIIFIFLCSLAKVNAQNKIVANVTNFQNDTGHCLACLFNSAASFNNISDKPFQCVDVPVRNKEAQVVFTNIPANTYAIFLFHDKNNNHKFDKNFVGIPKEGYGASKNNLPFAWAPSFADNQFFVKENTATYLSIKLRNLLN